MAAESSKISFQGMGAKCVSVFVKMRLELLSFVYLHPGFNFQDADALKFSQDITPPTHSQRKTRKGAPDLNFLWTSPW